MKIVPRQDKAFPPHWGKPPELQTCDMRELPGGYGKGSSTLKGWVEEHLKQDEDSVEELRAADLRTKKS